MAVTVLCTLHKPEKFRSEKQLVLPNQMRENHQPLTNLRPWALQNRTERTLQTVAQCCVYLHEEKVVFFKPAW